MAEGSAKKGNETISYEEYIDRGIPDTLLEGLGFYKGSPSTEPEAFVDEDSMDADTDSKDGYSIDVKDTSVTVASNDSQKSFSRLRNHRMPKIVLKSPVKANSPARHSAPVLPKSVAPNPQNALPYRGARTTSKVVVKGNIMYERTETGEVIASVIKNGVPTSGIVSPAVTAPTSKTSAPGRGRPPAGSENRFSSPTVGATTSTNEYLIPQDCPINENTVEYILDESISATQAMRRTLTNLKDDLRRMGGGPTVTPALKPIHIQHRIEVACKLACAFVDYRELITNINNNRTVDESVHVKSAPRDSNDDAKTATPTYLQNVRQRKKSAFVSPVLALSEPVDEQKSKSTSKRKPDVPVPSSSKRVAVAQVESIVSEDLWMSCEPCD